LFEQGKVLLRPGLSQLKAELLNFTTYWDRKQDASPNRMDAMVWSLTRLKALILDIPMA
jgi:phage terminase large subunit-like protein